jgi:hypothetical protein
MVVTGTGEGFVVLIDALVVKDGGDFICKPLVTLLQVTSIIIIKSVEASSRTVQYRQMIAHEVIPRI